MKTADFETGDYEAKLQRYERDLAGWKRSASEADPPEKPEKPTMCRTWADDLTIEALAALLHEQPRGLLVACDELASWFGGFDRYSQSSGGDAARWLQMHGGRQMIVDRKTGDLYFSGIGEPNGRYSAGCAQANTKPKIS